MSEDAKGVYTSADVARMPLRERVGFSIEAKNTTDALIRIMEAESAGVRQVWMTGGASGSDTLTLYAAAAAQTSKIQLGTSIVPIYPRHPLVVAQQALAIYDLAPGRLRLGIGPSNPMTVEQTYGLAMRSPLTYLAEYLAILRSTLWDGAVVHRGRFFNVSFTMQRKARIPLLVSALGERAFNVAGEISDGAISWLCPIPYLLNKAVPAMKEGAKARNRPVPPLVGHVLAGISVETKAVVIAARRRLERYVRSPFYLRMFAAAGKPIAADGVGIDALADELVMAGDESAVKQRLVRLLEGGLDEILVSLVPVADEERERRELLHLIGSL